MQSAQSATEHRDLRRTFLPVAVAVAAVLLVVALLSWHGAERQDAIARARSIELVARIIDDTVEGLMREAKDYAWWNNAAEALVVELDPVWADDNIGAYVNESFGYEYSFVIDEADITRYASIDGERTAADAFAYLGNGLVRLLERTRSASEQYEPVPAGGLLTSPRGLVAAGASLVTAEGEGDVDLPPDRSAVVVFVEVLDAAFWRSFGERYGLERLRLLPPGSGSIMLPLDAVDGTPLGGLAWTPPKPGAAYFRAISPIVGLAVVVVAVVTTTVLRRATRTLVASEARFRDVADATSDWIWETDAAGRLRFVSERFHEVTGIHPATVRGRHLGELLDIEEGVSERSVGALLAGGRSFRNVLCNQTAGGEHRFVRLAGKPLRRRARVLGYRGTATDVTREAEAERRARFLASHDALTGLPNRSNLHERLENAIANALRRAERAAVICLDLDRFKLVNDTLGHTAGDRLIVRVAERLTACVRDIDTIARLGGDEFAVIQAVVKGPNDVAALCRRMLDVLAEPIDLDGNEVLVTASLGVALIPDDADEPGGALKSADIALYRAKEDGGNDIRFFEPEMDARLQERQAIEQDLRLAIARGELELHYQPQIAVGDGRLIGVEALLRWQHPVRGPLAPGTFLPIAEESGLILPLGEWVLREACRQAAAWPDIVMSINLSPVQFRHRDLVASVRRALDDSGLEPTRLELEITESALLLDLATAVRILGDLQALGVRISMDDFGTGYSSLSHLQKVPVTKLKIDMDFIRALEADADIDAIVRAMVGLGRSLRLKTCAEGVETAEQLAFLSAAGCDEAQGFHLGRPARAGEIAARYFDREARADEALATTVS